MNTNYLNKTKLINVKEIGLLLQLEILKSSRVVFGIVILAYRPKLSRISLLVKLHILRYGSIGPHLICVSFLEEIIVTGLLRLVKQI